MWRASGGEETRRGAAQHEALARRRRALDLQGAEDPARDRERALGDRHAERESGRQREPDTVALETDQTRRAEQEPDHEAPGVAEEDARRTEVVRQKTDQGTGEGQQDHGRKRAAQRQAHAGE